MNIYDLTGQYKILENACLLNADDEELKAEFDRIKDDIKTKADGYAKVIANLEGTIKVIDGEEKRLADRKKTIKNNIKNLKDNLLWSMRETGEEKFKTDLFSFGIVKNGGLEPLVIDVAAEELPAELQDWSVAPDKDAIREYIKETGDLSYAHFEERGEHLSIR